MHLTPEQLEELTTLAGLFFSVNDIIIALDIDPELHAQFSYIISCENENPIYRAYHTGRLTEEIKLREAIKLAAMNGSNPAQNTLINYFNNSKP